MAGTDRIASYAVELGRALQQAPYTFDFFQAVRRLEGIYQDKPRIGHSLRPVDDPIRLGQDPSMAFAPSTLASFDPGKGGVPPRLGVLFFGLFGPNGPLPLHLTDYARDRMRNANDPTFAGFADMFHHRLLALFYRAWASTQPAVSFDRPESDRFSVYVGSLFGLGMPSLRNRHVMPDFPLLSYAGRLSCQTRNPEGLQALVGDFFNMPVEIEQFIGQWVELPDHYLWRLGTTHETGSLGISTTIGSHIWVCQQKFRIVMGPMDFAEYQRLLPGGHGLKRLTALVKSYVGDELDWDVRLILKKEEIPPLRLEKPAQLGWTSWLSPDALQEDAGDCLLNPWLNEELAYGRN